MRSGLPIVKGNSAGQTMLTRIRDLRSTSRLHNDAQALPAKLKPAFCNGRFMAAMLKEGGHSKNHRKLDDGTA
jgi:hypothetical protein